jgi:hypothetical protein
VGRNAACTESFGPTRLVGVMGKPPLAGNSKVALDAAVRLRGAYPQLRRIALKQLLRVRKVELTSLIDDLISRLSLPD